MHSGYNFDELYTAKEELDDQSMMHCMHALSGIQRGSRKQKKKTNVGDDDSDESRGKRTGICFVSH